MANAEHLEVLQQGVEVWNKWRVENSLITPDLRSVFLIYQDLNGADLSGVALRGASLHKATLRGANLREADLCATNLGGADLNGADLSGAKLFNTNLRQANLNLANLGGADLNRADLFSSTLFDADLHSADLRGANLSGARLLGANLSRANLGNADLSIADLSDADLSDTNLFRTSLNGALLSGADLSDALVGLTIFGGVDLSDVQGLDRVKHNHPSIIGIDTLFKSKGKIPKEFLLGCGVPESFITFIPAITGAVEPFQFHSCFISYSTRDEEFARRLHSRLRDERVRVWFAPEDMKGGQKVFEQIERAIQVHDRLLLVLSEHSLHSNWVETEIRHAIESGQREQRQKLFPIRLTDYDTLKNWCCFDADSGRDLARDVRALFIPDFSNWKDHDAFEQAFTRLINDLKAQSEG